MKVRWDWHAFGRRAMNPHYPIFTARAVRPNARRAFRGRQRRPVIDDKIAPPGAPNIRIAPDSFFPRSP
jgi:hypothetical protein